jgi:hypothetical protein
MQDMETDRYVDTLANMIAERVMKHLGVMPPPEKNDTTHRFYQCRVDNDKSDVMRCVKKQRAELDREQQIVTVKSGCPQIFDPLILSDRLKMRVLIDYRELK